MKICLISFDSTFFDHNIILELKKRNIYVRYFNKPRIDNYLRISIGTDAQMQALYAALKEIVNA